MYEFGDKFKPNEFPLLQLVFGTKVLGSIKSEKGKNKPKSKGSNWEKDSIFRLISDLGKNTSLSSHFGKPDFMVCDDLGITEVADFILVYDKDPLNQKIIFIHAKQSSKPKLYACLLYTSPSPRDATLSRMPSSA